MKVGILGGGLIVKTLLSFAEKIEDVEMTAIYTRRKEVAEELATKHNIKTVCKSFDELISLDDVDTIYVAVPNHRHFEYTLKALECGKNVVLEKPLTVTYEETEILCSKAKEKGLYLFEAISNLYTPVMDGIKEHFNKIGKVKGAYSCYMQYSTRYDDFKKGIIHPVFDAKKYGGVIMDLGIYCLHLFFYVLGKPKKAMYESRIERDVDIDGVFTFYYDDFTAESKISKISDGDCCFNIDGERGIIRCTGKPNELAEGYVEVDGKKYSYSGKSGAERMLYEWNAFAKIYREKDYNKMLCMLENSCEVMKILFELRTKGIYVSD